MSREDAVDKRKALTSGQIIAELHSAFLFYLFPYKAESMFQQTLFDALRYPPRQLGRHLCLTLPS